MNHDVIREIREKLDIVDVISSYIPLTKQGKNFFGICPFHDDNHPSMSVSREKQIYRCFSCGASGNVFTFVQNYEQISFKETLHLLAERAGVSLGNNFSVTEKKNKYEHFYQIYDLTNRLYQNNLQSKIGIQAKEYLKERGIGEDIIKEFGIGLSSGTFNQVTKMLEKKGYLLNDLYEVGLSVQDRDIYQERIMFPLFDTYGKCVAFSGRRYLNEEGSKYINTKETKIFVKGNLLYNYHRAREHVRLKKQVIVMEGFMDVIRAFCADVKNVVALMGTAMTHEQIGLLRRLSTDIVLCFDGDDAGRHATIVNGEALDKAGFVVKVVELSGGDDPDTYILKYGSESFQELVKNAITYQDFRIKNLKSGKNLNSDEEKAEYVHEVLQETSKIQDEIRREIILKNLAIEFNLSYNTLEKRLNEFLMSNKTETKPAPVIVTEKRTKKDKYYIAPRAVLYYMIQREDVLQYYEREGIFFPEERFRTFASEISYLLRKYGIMSLADFYTYLLDKEELLSLLQEIMELNLQDDVPFEVVLDYVQVMEDGYRNREIRRLKEEIRKCPDLHEKARLSEKVRSLKIGS